MDPKRRACGRGGVRLARTATEACVRLRRRAGFTLLEVTIALGLFATAVVSVAQLFSIASNSARLSRVSSIESVLAMEKLEQLRALAWGYDSDGTENTDTVTDVSVQPESAGGSGLTPSPASSLDANVPGFVDFLDDSGRWLGTGATVPPGTAFVRRWAIAPAADSPGDALVLRVVVATVQDCPAGGGPIPVRPTTTRLVAVRSRRAR